MRKRIACALVLSALVVVPSAGGWSWPVAGEVVQAFSFDEARPYAAGQHRGIDIAAPPGVPEGAAAGSAGEEVARDDGGLGTDGARASSDSPNAADTPTGPASDAVPVAEPTPTDTDAAASSGEGTSSDLAGGSSSDQ